MLELLAVVLIALLFSALAIASYSTMKQRRSLRTAAEGVNDVFTTARSYAVSRNAWHRVVFQVADPANPGAPGEPRQGYWIDEINPNSNNNPNPATLETAMRSLVVPWHDMPEGVFLLDANIKGTSFTATTGNAYWVVRFRPNGSSDDANIRMIEGSTATPTGPIVSEVRLYSATAKSKIVAARP